MKKLQPYISTAIIAVLVTVMAMQAFTPDPEPEILRPLDAQLASFPQAGSQSDGEVIELEPGEEFTVECPTRLELSGLFRSRWKKVTIKCVDSAITQTPSPTSERTDTPNPNPTETGETPTIETTASNTPPASPTASATPPIPSSPTPGGELIQPFASAPLCGSHDVNTWHGIWDYHLGCHYNHTHGDDPALSNQYFGPLGAFWDGSTISYPFKSSEMENTMKHPGYKISVRQPGYHPWPPCGTEDNTDITGDHSDNCMIASRVQYHGIGGTMDTLARYHSYWMEAYICRPPYQQPRDCGIMRTGGLLDFAQLQAPHYNARVFRPGGTVDFGNGMVMEFERDGNDLPARSGEPYVFSIPSSDVETYRRNSPKGQQGTLPGSFKATIDQWSSNDFDCEPRPAGDPCHNQHTHILFQVGDSFNLINTQNPNSVVWICYNPDNPNRQTNCEYDGSLIGLNEIALRVLQSWQPGGNGFVTLSGYSDKWGNPTMGCSAVSENCVPFVLEHAPVGVAASRTDNLCECTVWEYDIYFNNRPSGWIRFPN